MPRWNQKSIGAWAKETFGETNSGLLTHLKEEVEEFAEAYGTTDEPVEAADIVIILMNRAAREGYDLLDYVDFKMDRNFSRQWLPPDKDGVVRHKKGD